MPKLFQAYFPCISLFLRISIENVINVYLHRIIIKSSLPRDSRNDAQHHDVFALKWDSGLRQTGFSKRHQGSSILYIASSRRYYLLKSKGKQRQNVCRNGTRGVESIPPHTSSKPELRVRGVGVLEKPATRGFRPLWKVFTMLRSVYFAHRLRIFTLVLNCSPSLG